MTNITAPKSAEIKRPAAKRRGVSSRRKKSDDRLYINNNIGGARDSAADAFGNNVRDGVYSTRTGPRKFHTYDARLGTEVNVTKEDVDAFRRSLTSGHVCASVAKGVFISAPHMINAKTEVKFVEMMLQLSTAADAVGKNRLLKIFEEVPVNRVLAAITKILNHDGDLERAHPAEWWQWTKLPRPGPDDNRDGPGSPIARKDRFLRTRWARITSTAVTLCTRANQTRAEITHSRGIPGIGVFEVKKGAVPGKKITHERVSEINEDP